MYKVRLGNAVLYDGDDSAEAVKVFNQNPGSVLEHVDGSESPDLTARIRVIAEELLQRAGVTPEQKQQVIDVVSARIDYGREFLGDLLVGLGRSIKKSS